MADSKKPTKKKIRQEPNAKPLAINGSFMDVFKVVKKHKENNAKKP